VLDRLPALELINSRVDTALAQEVIERHLRQCGKQPRPIRWFPDAKSARAYAPAVQVMGRAVFPCFSGGPRAFTDAWTAGDALRKNDSRELARQEEHTCAPPIESIGALLEMFAAGVFYYWIRPHEVLSVRRPSLWMIKGQLHRADGPAVEWPTGERYFFWNGKQVPKWLIENPERITAERIRREASRVLRHCMMERFGMERFSILERWAEWQMCMGSFDDFDVFVASGLHRTFHAVSERITAYADTVVEGMTPAPLRKPQINRIAAADAISRFLREWGEPGRPLRWFDDGRSARTYVAGQSSELLRAAYWPELRIASVLDTAWYRDGVDPLHSFNMRWLQGVEDWQDWSLHAPRARDCHDPLLIQSRVTRVEDWIIATWRYGALPGRDVSPIDIQGLSFSHPAVRRWTLLMDAFAAGLFYYWIGPQEVVCVPRPALWIENGQLHRNDGPAVEWPTGERCCFWRGVEVPNWLIEQPERITLELIRSERNVELRRCMIELFGQERFLRETGADLVAEDEHGKLWRSELARQRPYVLLEVKNGTLDCDGTRRRYFLRVPPDMRTPHQAVAWTYGVSPAQYELAVRT
jgi:hypothetical protein